MRRPGRGDPVPHRGRRLDRHDELIAALAGVSGSADDDRDAGLVLDDEAHVVMAGRESGRRQHLVGLGALNRDHGEVLVLIENRDSGRRSLRQQLDDPRAVGGIRDQEDLVGRLQIGDHVVDDTALLVAEQRVLRLARLDPAESLVRHRFTYAAAPGPVAVALPRWLTSNAPTADRTAACSASTPPPAYSSGIDHPLNAANRAPAATCRSCSGETFTPRH